MPVLVMFYIYSKDYNKTSVFIALSRIFGPSFAQTQFSLYCVASGQYHVCKFAIAPTNSPKAFAHVNARNQAKFVQRHVYLIKDKTECNAMHNLAIVSTGARVASCEGDATASIECKFLLEAGAVTVRRVSFPPQHRSVSIPVDITAESHSRCYL